MQKYKSNITSTTGAAIRNVPVTVLTEAGELASLFLDRAGAIAAPNPLATDSSGNFYFYAVNGRYSLRTTVEGVTITDDDVVLLQDPEEITVAGPIAEAVAAAEAAAKQAQDAVEDSGIPQLVAAAQNAVVDAGEALKAAQVASKDAAAAKSGAEAAKGTAEQAGRDAQAAAGASGAAAAQAVLAAQTAAQSAASIDPASIYLAIEKKVDAQPNAGLMTDTERQKLGGVGAGATKNATDAQLRDRSSHTGKQPIASVDGLQEALNTAVQATSETGAALAPEGTDAQRPATGSIPAGKLVIRGSTQDAADYKTEFWDRGAGVWKVFADRTWVGKQIAAAVQAVKDWVDQQIGSTIIYPNGGSAGAPANVAINSRYVMPNPFPGSRVMCLAELQIGGVWGAAGFIYAAQGGLGVAAYPHGDPGADNIIVTTGGAGLCSTGVNSGSPHVLGANITTPTPCRVKVVKVKG